jgi:hypothetical protein
VIFLIDPYQPSGYTELYLSDEKLDQRYETESTRRMVERHAGLTCEPVLEGRNVLYRCR